MDFWKSTPHETGVWYKARAEREQEKSKQEWHRTVFATWHGAYFHRLKAMPKYERMLEMIGMETAKAQTADEMLKVAEQMTIAMGGKVKQRIESGSE